MFLKRPSVPLALSSVLECLITCRNPYNLPDYVFPNKRNVFPPWKQLRFFKAHPNLESRDVAFSHRFPKKLYIVGFLKTHSLFETQLFSRSLTNEKLHFSLEALSPYLSPSSLLESLFPEVRFSCHPMPFWDTHGIPRGPIDPLFALYFPLLSQEENWGHKLFFLILRAFRKVKKKVSRTARP